jgi:hypothetical protein
VTSPSSNPHLVDQPEQVDQYERAADLIELVGASLSGGNYLRAFLDAQALVDALTRLAAPTQSDTDYRAGQISLAKSRLNASLQFLDMEMLRSAIINTHEATEILFLAYAGPH